MALFLGRFFGDYFHTIIIINKVLFSVCGSTINPIQLGEAEDYDEEDEYKYEEGELQMGNFLLELHSSILSTTEEDVDHHEGSEEMKQKTILW